MHAHTHTHKHTHINTRPTRSSDCPRKYPSQPPEIPHRRYNDIYRKLGGDSEASRAMGKLLADVGGGFAGRRGARQLEDLFWAHR